MTIGGWINLVLSVGSVSALFVWCLHRVLTSKPPAENVVEESLRDRIDPPG